jgi:hypothetical protein
MKHQVPKRIRVEDRESQYQQFDSKMGKTIPVALRGTSKMNHIPYKAIVYSNYGSADVLKREEMEKPAAGDDEVLIKVRAASVNPVDLLSKLL